MSVIVDLAVPARSFSLGRILGMKGETKVVLESVVPLGDQSVPFIRVFEGRDSFQQAVNRATGVTDIREISSHDGEILYALDWDIGDDDFFQGVMEHDGTVMQASGGASTWSFELRFEDHDHLSSFQEYCMENDIDIDVLRLFNPTRPDAGPWYGLTPAQRNAITRAVESGYYSIPRKISTRELAAEFDISDQAMTERLRRGITNLVTNTIQVPETETKPQ